MDEDVRDWMNNELKRVKILGHPNYETWYASLPEYTRMVVDRLMEEDATAEMIELAQDAPDEEWNAVLFLRALGGGNPEPHITLALTDFVLNEIWGDVLELASYDK